MLGEKTNGSSLDLKNPFDFEAIIYSLPLSSFKSNILMLFDKQIF